MTTVKPEYLLVPPLYEESGAQVSWEDVPDASQYELDIVYNEDFDSASQGKSWSDIELAGWTWEGQEEEDNALRWQDLEKLPAQGLMWRNIEFQNQTWKQWDEQSQATWQWIQEHPPVFTTYTGPGEDVPAPDQGKTWANMDSADWNWQMQEDSQGLTWKEISLLPSVGLEWWQHDQNGFSWAEMESTYPAWTSMEEQPTRALTWGSLEGRWLDWNQIQSLGEEGEGLSWWEMEHLPPNNQTQKGCDIETPLYTKKSMMRVRSTDMEGQNSDYLTTAPLKHWPRSLRKYKAPCLDIPALYEGKKAEIVWGNLYGASGYYLERRCKEQYEARYNGPGTVVPHPEGCKGPEDHYYGPDCKFHLAAEDTIPYYEKTAQYRIKGYNTTDCSQYLESTVVPIIPVFYRNDNVSFSVVKDQEYLLPLYASDIETFDNIVMTLEYPSAVLTEIPLSLNALNAATLTKLVKVKTVSSEPGKYRCTCEEAIPSGSAWSGCILCKKYRALNSGNVTIHLY